MKDELDTYKLTGGMKKSWIILTSFSYYLCEAGSPNAVSYSPIEYSCLNFTRIKAESAHSQISLFILITAPGSFPADQKMFSTT